MQPKLKKALGVDASSKQKKGDKNKMQRKIFLATLLLLLTASANATPDVNVVYPNGGEYLWGRINIDFNVAEPWNQPTLNAALYYSETPGNNTHHINTIDLLDGNYCTPGYTQEEMWQYMNGEAPTNMPEQRFSFFTNWNNNEFDNNLMYFGKYIHGTYGSYCYWTKKSGYIDADGNIVETNELDDAYDNIPPTGTNCYSGSSTGGGNPPQSTFWGWYNHKSFFKPSSLTPAIGLTYYYAPNCTVIGCTSYYYIKAYDWSSSVFDEDDGSLFDWFDWQYYTTYSSSGCSPTTYLFSGNVCQDNNCARVLFKEPFVYNNDYWLVGRWQYSPNNFVLCTGDPDPTTWQWHGFNYLGDGNWQRNDTFTQENTDLNLLTWNWQGDEKCEFQVWEDELYCMGQNEDNKPVAIKWNDSTQKWELDTDFNKGIVEQAYESASGSTPFYTTYQNALYQIQNVGPNSNVWKKGDLVWNTTDTRTCSYSWHTGDANGTWYLDINVSNGKQSSGDSSDGNFTIDNNNFLEIVSPEDGSDFKAGALAIVFFRLNDLVGKDIVANQIKYQTTPDSEWESVSPSYNAYTNTYYFFYTMPYVAGDYLLTVDANMGGKILSDSISYNVIDNDLLIEWVKPTQAIYDANFLVVGKPLVVRVKVVNNGPESFVTTKLSCNGQDYTDTREIGSYAIIDFENIPPYSQAGNDQIIAKVDPDNNITEPDENNNTKSVNVNIIRTYGFKVIYRPLEYYEADVFEYLFHDSNYYMSAIYPLEPNQLESLKNDTVYERPQSPPLSWFYLPWPEYLGLRRVLDDIKLAEITARDGLKTYDRIVAIVPPSWLTNSGYSPGNHGLAVGMHAGAASDYPVIIAEVSSTITSHEISHSFGLCDEKPDCGGLLCSLCPNEYKTGHIVDGYWVQIENSPSCSILKSTDYPCDPELDNVPCIMTEAIVGSWIGKDSFDYLTNLFSTPHTEKETVLVVRGTVYEDHNVLLDPFYIGEGYARESFSGPYALQLLDNNNQTLAEYDFNVDFRIYANTPIDTNVTTFLFSVPYKSNTSKIRVEYEGVTKAERDVSNNAPTITITSPKTGDTWTDINTLQWDANDLDGNDLNFIVQYSNNDGNTWDSLIVNIPDTNYTLDINKVHPSNSCKFRVIATDGVLTSTDSSETFIVKEPDINVSRPFWNFMNIARGEIVSIDFNIFNRGNETLTVYDINTPSNISVSGASFPLTLQPDESQTISTTMDSLNYSGDYAGDINISSNDPNEPLKRIFVWGHVENTPPLIYLDINAPYQVNLFDSFELNAKIYSEDAPLRDANIVISLPEGLSTKDSQKTELGNIFLSESKDVNWTIDVNKVGLFEIILTLSSSLASDYNKSRFAFVTAIEITGLTTDKNAYNLDETVKIDANVTNSNPDLTYADLNFVIAITTPQDNNIYIYKNINWLYADSTQELTIEWDANKTSGQHNITAHLYDYDGELLDTSVTNFEVNLPTMSWILGYGGNKLIGTDYNISYSILEQPTKKFIGQDYNVILGGSYYYE